MDECLTLTGGRIVLPGEVLVRGSVSIRNGRIVHIGATTFYHGLSLSHASTARKTRNTDMIERLAATLLEYRRSGQGLIRHRIHLRFEI
ncbi:MAG: hypothetical protein ACYCYO_18060 [Bacilli bacterium]